MVTPEGIELIKKSNDLAEVLTERGVKLQRKGRVLVALCPFREEKTPSFTVTPSRGLYHCFGCDAAGDVIGFLVRHEGMDFKDALEFLARRAGLALSRLMEQPPATKRRTPVWALTPPPAVEPATSALRAPARPATHLLNHVVEHYHKTFCERADAQGYLAQRGLTNLDMLRAHKIGYADGSLLKLVPREGTLRDELRTMGVISQQGRELLGGCVVVPIKDPLTGEWTTLYGRGLRTPRHCYLPGPLRGVFNYQAACAYDEVVLTESVLDALSFHQANVPTAIPIYGTSGFTPDHLDLLKRERVRSVVLALDNDEAGRRATSTLRKKLAAAGLLVRTARFPNRIKDANELLVSVNGPADDVFLALVVSADPQPPSSPEARSAASASSAEGLPLSEKTASSARVSRPAAVSSATKTARTRSTVARASSRTVTAKGSTNAASSNGGGAVFEDGQLVLQRGPLTYRCKVYPVLLGRLRATVKVERANSKQAASEPATFHVDTLDLYASRSRTEFARRANKALNIEDPEVVEADLLALLVEAEKVEGLDEDDATNETRVPPPMTDAERKEALELLKRKDLLDQVGKDVDALGYVGEEVNKRLLYLVAVSRKLPDPLSAVILSQSGAGKSGITEVIERLTPPEDVVLLTRLTPQSLYYVEQSFLDQKLVIVEERYGSAEADYSIRVLQSRKKLIAAAPVKDPQSGNLKTKVFTVEARAAFIEATTASAVNHENATRCFELCMDESVEQTKRIHHRQRLMKTERGLKLHHQAEVITRRHWNAQRLLEPLPVVIPYADKLSFPASWMRTRRDHARFLNLIEVSAFLHQHQRQRVAWTPPRRGKGTAALAAIVASVADYAVAYALSSQVLAETLSDVRKPLREAYERIKELSLKGDGTVSRRQIRETLAVPDSTVRRWLNDLVEYEYLAAVTADGSRPSQGKTVRYRPLDLAPRENEILGLLAPADLRKRLKGREKR
ncbi:MAG: CHC2 zinc finger domain-containing protein [Nitrosopumilus sp.]|nr:CHC2 zinc finger domain-containing protein [Nitrosopumilus sp.]